MKIFYFTGTGNSLSVAKRIGGELFSIPQEMSKERLAYEDEAIGIVFPVYYGSLPKIVGEFLKKASFQTDYMFAVATCGNGVGAAFYDLQKIAEKKGNQFDYMNTVVMVDNFLPVFDIESEIRKLPEKNTEEMCSQIVNDISHREKSVPSFSMKTKMFSAIAKKMMKEKVKEFSSDSFSINDDCTLCGTCALVCPVGNVSVSGKVSFANKCENCYACVHACPKKAIHLIKEKSDAHFRNPEVSLKEIIEANSQKKTNETDNN